MALETAVDIAAEVDGAALDAAAELGADAATLLEELELELVEDELQAAMVSARAAVPAARNLVLRFTQFTP